ncbi:hypothetical protein SEA_WOFFORD_28 [Streptomyces phage Wofford]|uniref:Uncharacterized protein n=1 Tax=Streptomyces phage Wofford TaxID=2283267 RepID=A0A345M9Q4_9CAUD|nr:hypothetical protein HWB78_gp028 [Streptomyces phage Wollford]AXH67225.1 hypothetical protein SEA_WOFFORD_28 [Streptomyces phage Wollford]
MTTREGAEQILSLFLFEDVCNNTNHYEGTHEITYVGDHFAVREIRSGEIHTFKVVMVPSDLPASDWVTAFEEQGWLEVDED